MKKLLTLLALATALVAGPAAAEKSNALLIGQSASLTGGQAKYGQDVRDGIEALFNAVNQKGGVHGRPLQLVTLDDGGKKDAVLANTKALVDQHKAIALVGYTSGAGVEASLPYLDGAGVPLVGPATGNMGIRADHRRVLFHVRAGYWDEMRKMADHLALMGRTRFAVAYLNDVGPANAKAMVDALKRNSLQPVASVALNRNAENFNREAETLLKGEPEVVLFISNATPVVKLVAALKARGYNGQFGIASFAGLSVIDELAQSAHGLILSQVLPPPTSKHLKLIADYQADMAAYKPGAAINYTSLEGYLAARVLVEGVRRAAGDSSAKVIAGLESLQRVDLGGYEIDLSATSHAGSRYVNTGIVDRNGQLRF